MPNTKPILLGNVYRPPDQSGFLDNFPNAIFNTPNFDNQEVYILGDFNVNLKYAGRRIPNGVTKYRESYTVNQVTYKNYEKYINHLRSYTHKFSRQDTPGWNL